MSGKKKSKAPVAEQLEDKRETLVLVPSDDILKKGAQIFRNGKQYANARFVDEIHIRSLQPGTVVHVLLPKAIPEHEREVERDARGFVRKKNRRSAAMALSAPVQVSDYWNSSDDQRHEGPRLHGDEGLIRAIADLALSTERCDPMVIKMGRGDTGKIELIRLQHV